MIAVAARRCSRCLVNWPNGYRTCPECLHATKNLSRDTPITLQEARKRATGAEFDRFYARHDEERVGATPEELGHLEAQQERRQLRELERIFKAPARLAA